MLINLKRGEQIPYERIIEVEYPLVTYSQAGRTKVAELSDDGITQLEAIGMRWINCTDDAGTYTLIPVNQVETIQQIEAPQGSNADPAWVANTLSGKRYHLSQSTYRALASQLFDVYGDLADKPSWME